MPGATPLLPLLFADSCTPQTPVPTDAVSQDAAVLDQGATRTADVLLVVDGSPTFSPEVVPVVAPLIAEHIYATTAPEAIQFVASWSEFDDLLARYSSIGLLVLWTHGTGLKEIYIGGKSRTLTALSRTLIKPEMPTLYSVAIEGCGVGLDVQGMLQMVSDLGLNTLTAWPLYVGFHYTRVETWAEEDVRTELTGGADHVLAPRTVAEITRQNLLAYSYLYAGDLEAAHFPMLHEIPADQRADPAGYRADHGYPARVRANTYLIPKETPTDLNALVHEEALFTHYAQLRDRAPGSAVDPYDHTVQVIVM